MEKVRIGEPLPELEADAVDGERVRLPGALRGQRGIVLLYRGHW